MSGLGVGQPRERWNTETLRSLLAWIQGDLSKAEEYLNSALAIGSETVPEAMAVYRSQLLVTRLFQGCMDEVAALAEAMATLASDHGGLPILRSGLAMLYCRLGRDAEALEVIEVDIADRFAQFPYDMTWVQAMVLLSDICVHLRRNDGGSVLYERLLPWHSQIAVTQTTAQGPVARVLGNLATLSGRYED
ncbi:MAG TPA: hypothetical protein VLX59_02135, partial [Acidimicrobiales bacterium]|nr:hypothetical protein [Acidimicrobiales bacterium]